MNPVCIIPARGTSPSLPKRHFKHLDGDPLLAHSTRCALDSESLDRVFVSTEDPDLASLVKEYGAEVPLIRPSRLGDKDVFVYETIQHAVEELRAETDVRISEGRKLVVLQPNVPFRRPRDVDAAVSEYECSSHESVITVVEDDHFYWRHDDEGLQPQFESRNVLRSELDPFYRETGSVYVTNQRLLDQGRRVSESPGFVVTDRLSALEVNSVLYFWLAEQVATGPKLLFRVDGGDDIGMGTYIAASR